MEAPAYLRWLHWLHLPAGILSSLRCLARGAVPGRSAAAASASCGLHCISTNSSSRRWMFHYWGWLDTQHHCWGAQDTQNTMCFSTSLQTQNQLTTSRQKHIWPAEVAASLYDRKLKLHYDTATMLSVPHHRQLNLQSCSCSTVCPEQNNFSREEATHTNKHPPASSFLQLYCGSAAAACCRPRAGLLLCHPLNDR